MASLPAPDRRRPALYAALGWAMCCGVMLWVFRGSLVTLNFRDPDDAMRLIQVRDWVGGQAFWDVSQHRVNPPLGGPMHWSRIVDMPIAGLILLLRPLVGAAVAELVACALVPLLLLGGLVATLFVTARRIGGDGVALLSVLMLVTAPTILTQFTPLRIDHHGWQIAMAAGALCGAMDSRAGRGGMIAGLAIALWLQISSEALPYAALFAAVFALRFWLVRDAAPRFMAYVLTLGGGALALLIALRGPQAALARQCDALSYVYIWPLVALALSAGAGAWIIGFRTSGRRFAVAAVGGGAAIATFIATGGPCLSGDPFAALGPVAYRLWYLQVMEGRPLWEQSLSMATINLLPSIIGLIAMMLAARRSTGAARQRWMMATLLLMGAIAVSMMVNRALAVAHVFALPGLAWAQIMLFRRVQASPVVAWRVLGTSALVLLTPVGLCAIGLSIPTKSDAAIKASTDCRTAAVLAPLGKLPRATLFAPIDLGPDILVRTPHSVVSTGHHRNAVGITAVIEGFVGAPDAARAIILRSNADYVLTCDGLNEMPTYEQENPRGLAAVLAHGAPPSWLVPMPAKRPLRIYRVRRP